MIPNPARGTYSYEKRPTKETQKRPIYMKRDLLLVPERRGQDGGCLRHAPAPLRRAHHPRTQPRTQQSRASRCAQISQNQRLSQIL